MTIPKVRPGGWGAGTAYASAEASQFDTNFNTRCLDKGSGQTDVCQSTVTFNTGSVTLAGATVVTGVLNANNVSTLTMNVTNRVTLASRSITRVADYFGPTYINADWTFQGTPHHILNTGTNKTAWQSLHFPDGSTITEVAALIQGAAHSASWPVGVPNRIGLYEVSLANGGATLLGSFTQDLSAQATYESEHWLVMSGLSIAVDRTLKSYRLAFLTESGTNAIAGQAFDSVRVKYTITSMDED